MSERVRLLDLEQSRIQSTLKLLDDVLDIQHCASSVRRCMASQSYQEAAVFVDRYLKHDPLMIAAVFDPADLQSPDRNTLAYLLEDGSFPIDILDSAQKELCAVVSQGFEAAVQVTDKDAMIHNLKLFPLMGQSDLGLEKFGKYLNSIVARQCQDGMRMATSLDSSKSHRIYVELLTQLYEAVALIVDQQAGLVESIFGPGKILVIILSLKKEADKQSCIFLDSFCDYRQLSRRVRFLHLDASFICIGSRYQTSRSVYFYTSRGNKFKLGTPRLGLDLD